ncbi:MAG: FAD-dependent oxidoreductase [Pseudomonadota bacterium]|jgi:NAD(P)H-nitrite reductase large subunit|nr:FAD-dependent oxidoreductase [Pseudomonadota bacterium]
MVSNVVIIGNGIAGVSAAQALRAQGYEGRVFLIGDEPALPYDRPSLSKAVLGGDVTEPPLLVPSDWYDEAGIDLVVGTAVTHIDLRKREVALKDGQLLKADRILIATGAEARRPDLPGKDLPGVGVLRKLHDVQQLLQNWTAGQRLVIMGGGLIGCEVASTARKQGIEVTILEASDELLQRVLGRRLGAWCRKQLEMQGVSVSLNTSVACFEGGERLHGVTDSDGKHFEADHALICVGAAPATELASAAGLDCDRGIVVDATGATSVEGIYAAGDVAAWPLRGGGRRSLETYLNSQKQATAVAAAMLGSPAPQPQVPLSWTEISGHRLQMIGEIEGPGTIVERGDVEGGAGMLFRLLDGKMEAVIAVGSARDFAVAMRMVENQSSVDAAILQDETISMRDISRIKKGGGTV